MRIIKKTSVDFLNRKYTTEWTIFVISALDKNYNPGQKS